MKTFKTGDVVTFYCRPGRGVIHSRQNAEKHGTLLGGETLVYTGKIDSLLCFYEENQGLEYHFFAKELGPSPYTANFGQVNLDMHPTGENRLKGPAGLPQVAKVLVNGGEVQMWKVTCGNQELVLANTGKRTKVSLVANRQWLENGQRVFLPSSEKTSPEKLWKGLVRMLRNHKWSEEQITVLRDLLDPEASWTHFSLCSRSS